MVSVSRGVQVVDRGENSGHAIAPKKDKELFMIQYLQSLLASYPTTYILCRIVCHLFLTPDKLPSQVDLLLSDSVTSGMVRLWTPSVETAILLANVEPITSADNKEDEFAGENHAKSGVEVKRIISDVIRPNIGRSANGVDERKTISSLLVGSSDME
jgi:hypothetical protein